jgi:hypothetical protein
VVITLGIFVGFMILSGGRPCANTLISIQYGIERGQGLLGKQGRGGGTVNINPSPQSAWLLGGGYGKPLLKSFLGFSSRISLSFNTNSTLSSGTSIHF